MGMCRPDGNAGKKRQAFNWAHRICGLLTYFLAVATMLIGTNIHYMRDILKTAGSGILAGLIALPFLVFIILQVINESRGGKCLKFLKIINVFFFSY